MTTPDAKLDAYAIAGSMLANEVRSRRKRFAPGDEHNRRITRELEMLARIMRLASLGKLKADTTRRPGVKRDRSKERRRGRR